MEKVFFGIFIVVFIVLTYLLAGLPLPQEKGIEGMGIGQGAAKVDFHPWYRLRPKDTQDTQEEVSYEINPVDKQLIEALKRRDERLDRETLNMRMRELGALDQAELERIKKLMMKDPDDLDHDEVVRFKKMILDRALELIKEQTDRKDEG